MKQNFCELELVSTYVQVPNPSSHDGLWTATSGGYNKLMEITPADETNIYCIRIWFNRFEFLERSDYINWLLKENERDCYEM